MIEEEVWNWCCPYCKEEILIKACTIFSDAGGVAAIMICISCGKDFKVWRQKAVVEKKQVKAKKRYDVLRPIKKVVGTTLEGF